MKRILMFLGALLFVSVTAFSVVWVAMPRTASNILIKLNNASAGLTAKTVETPIGSVHYLEGGRGETVLLIHGIYARKEHWVEVARDLVPDYHVVALDLPGFGGNEPLEDTQYNLENQSRNLGLVVDALNLDQVHIAANSMGAPIAGLYTTANPDKVITLAFIGSPLGVPSPIKSDMEIAMTQGKFPLLVRSPDDFYARNKWLSPQTLNVPSPIMRTWLSQELAQADKNEAIWQAVHSGPEVINLLDLATDLDLKTLTIWCKEDRIFHISGAEELIDRLPHARLEILEECGHVPMLDKPAEVATLYREFLQHLNLSQKTQDPN